MLEDNIKSELIADPVGVYERLSARIREQGMLAPMPEFEPVVRYLQRELKDKEVVGACQENAFMEGQRQLALNSLWHCDLRIEVSSFTGGYHQHQPPFEQPFPYLPTLQAVDAALSFFDSYERSRKAGHDFHYQLDRYRYHSMTLPYLPDWIVVPTEKPLELIDLLILRAVPIGLTMTTSRTEFLDAYFNSPMNAKVHDDNHNRRFRSENQGYFERNGITTDEGKLEAYRHFNDIIQNTVLPSIEITPDMPEEEVNIRKAMTLLYFEWLHEYAKTPDRESLITELKFMPDGPSAFEVTLRPEDSAETIEERRTKNRNLNSGAIFAQGRESCGTYYFMDKGRNFLTSAYNKIAHGFYDNERARCGGCPDMSSRTPQVFLEATKRIMTVFNIESRDINLTDQYILDLLVNESGKEQLGTNLETYPGHNQRDPLNNKPSKIKEGELPDTLRQGFLLG